MGISVCTQEIKRFREVIQGVVSFSQARCFQCSIKFKFTFSPGVFFFSFEHKPFPQATDVLAERVSLPLCVPASLLCLKYTPCLQYVCVCEHAVLHYSAAAMLIHLFPLPLYNYKLLLSVSEIHSLSLLCHILILLLFFFPIPIHKAIFFSQAHSPPLSSPPLTLFLHILSF